MSRVGAGHMWEKHNDNQLAAPLSDGRISELLTGDIQARLEEWLLGGGLDLGNPVLKVAHHRAWK